MNKFICMAALILLSVQGIVCAQPLVLLGMGKNEYELKDKQKTPHRHVLYLDDKWNQMEIRLNDLKEYQFLENIDSILTVFMKDIEFYKDSLKNLGSDYVYISYKSFSQDYAPRFLIKTHEAKGKYFVKKDGTASILKVNQDTIHIALVNELPDSANRMVFGFKNYSIQHIYFYLNNYSDLEKYINAGNIQRYIDTMAKAVVPKQKKKGFTYSTVFYKPYENDKAKRLLSYPHQITDGNVYRFYIKNSYFDKISFNGNIGIGLIRDKAAPMAVIGLEYRNYWTRGEKECSILGLYASPYFLFNKEADGKYNTHNSWFVNFELGTTSVQGILELLNLSRFTIGGGYLFNPDGLYFQNTTIKVFSNITLSRGITVSPEVISTNNFKNIFPGITVKVF